MPCLNISIENPLSHFSFQNGFYIGIVFGMNKMQGQFLRRCGKGDGTDNPAENYAAGERQKERNEEYRGAGSLVQVGVQGGKPVIFYGGDAVGAEADKERSAYDPLDFAGEPDPQNRHELQQHHAVKD